MDTDFTKMDTVSNLLVESKWLWLIYQITFDKNTGCVEFREDNPLPKNLTDFFKSISVSISKENRTLLKDFAKIYNDYRIYQEMIAYLRTTSDNETAIVQQLLRMSCNFQNKTMNPAEFVACFMEPTKNDGHYALTFNEVMFNCFQEKQLHEIMRALELINKHSEAIAAWYEQTSVMTEVFLPLDKQYIEWFSKKYHAFHYANRKKEYLEKAMKEQEEMIHYLEPPPPYTKESLPECHRDWLSESDDEPEPEWRDQELCSANPHQCRCYLCISQNLLFCECPVCFQKQAINAEILEKKSAN